MTLSKVLENADSHEKIKVCIPCCGLLLYSETMNLGHFRSKEECRLLNEQSFAFNKVDGETIISVDPFEDILEKVTLEQFLREVNPNCTITVLGLESNIPKQYIADDIMHRDIDEIRHRYVVKISSAKNGFVVNI